MEAPGRWLDGPDAPTRHAAVTREEPKTGLARAGSIPDIRELQKGYKNTQKVSAGSNVTALSERHVSACVAATRTGFPNE